MAIGTVASLKAYDAQFFAGAAEVLQQSVEGFNAASAGALRLFPQLLTGAFAQEAFFTLPSGLIADRDPTAVDAVTPAALAQGEVVAPKISKRIGPVENTLDSFKKAGLPAEQMAFVLGRQSAPSIQAAYLNSALAGLSGLLGHAGCSWPFEKSNGMPLEMSKCPDLAPQQRRTIRLT